MRGKATYLLIGTLLCLVFPNVDLGLTEIKHSTDTDKLEIEVGQLSNQVEIVREDISKITKEITELGSHVQRMKDQLTPEQREFCEKLIWFQENAAFIDKQFRDIGSVRLDFAGRYWEIVATIAVLFVAIIAASGLGIFCILSTRIQKQATSAAQTEMLKTTTALQSDIGWSYWINYQITKDPQCLDMAIQLAQAALTKADDLDKRQPENELNICNFNNNLAYYLAERQRPEDKEVARAYAKYIYERLSKFPEKDHKAWVDTYKFVLKRFPEKEKNTAQSVLKKMMQAFLGKG